MTLDFLSLPSEVIHNIFNKVNPADLARLRQSCHPFHDFIQSDWLIVKDVFLEHFDDPRLKREALDSSEEPSWEADLHKYVRTGKILASKDADLKQAELIFVAETIGQLVNSSSTDPGSSRNLAFLADYFGEENQQNKDILVCSSSLFRWAEADVWRDGSSSANGQNTRASSEGTNTCQSTRGDRSGSSSSSNRPDKTPVDNETERKRQMLSAKLHCLYGVPIHEVHRGNIQTESKRYSLRNDTAPLHPYVRSRVYDLRQHTKNHNASFWGPYIANGTQEVDWEKVEAIMVILHHNMSHFARTHDLFSEDAIPNWTVPFRGVTAHTYRSKKPDPQIPLNPPVPLAAQDPYNVSGTWMRVVCFLDYSELYEFNFGRDALVPPHAPRRPLNTEEATRLITMRIQVTKITPPGEDEGQALPVVHFNGTSSSVRPSWDPNANSEIKGTVKLTPAGEVRWTTWSIFHGEERWRSEGIQVGGPQSERGVLGFWFDKDYDVHGPAGPTAFWKSHDGVEKRQPPGGRVLGNGLHALHVPLY